VEILDERPHDPDAFTQGLEMNQGRLFESTGRYGQSTLREVDPLTGEVIRYVDLPGSVFGEGLTFSEGEILVLTWQSGRVFRFDPETFEVNGEFFTGLPGWGICRAGDSVITSDGSSILTFRDPLTFEPVGSVQVEMDGVYQYYLNELEYVDGYVYANKWQTPYILKIDPWNGSVAAIIDATELVELVGPGVDVLNGIAWSPGDEAFILTGKLWPSMFLVEFVPVSR
jgi:glutaminyl-peptide cyclotransferase